MRDGKHQEEDITQWRSEKLFFNIILNGAPSEGNLKKFNDFISGKRLLILYY